MRRNPGETLRVFPLSNWTELDVWQYIHLEQIPIVPLYYAAPRPTVVRDGTIIMEMQASRTSEREGRLIDSDSVGSMEKKKQEGDF